METTTRAPTARRRRRTGDERGPPGAARCTSAPSAPRLRRAGLRPAGSVTGTTFGCGAERARGRTTYGRRPRRLTGFAARRPSVGEPPSGPLGPALLETAVVAAAGTCAGASLGPVHHVELLQAPPGADRDAGQGRLGQMDGHVRLVTKPLVETVEQRSPAGEHDPAVHDVGRELGWGLVERLLDRVEDLGDRLFERVPHLLGGEDDRLL